MSFKDPAFQATAQIAVGVTAIAGLFEDAMARLLQMPKHDGRYSQAEVKGIVDTAEHLGASLKEAMDIIFMAGNREERYLEEIAGYENRVNVLKQLLADQEVRCAQLEAELAEAAGGNSSVRISIPKSA